MPLLNETSNYCVLYVFLEYWKTILKNHPSIGFVSQGDVFSTDIKEFPMYPLANVYIDELKIVPKTVTYSCVLTIADKTKLINVDSIDATNKQIIPYEGIDDLLDIYANTNGIINDVLAFTNNFGQFELGEVTCIPFVDRFDNGLAGWVVSFDVTVPNSCFSYCTLNLNP
jgi:hypothetical protein